MMLVASGIVHDRVDERVDELVAGMSRGDVVHYELEGCLPILDRRPGLPFADDECLHGRLAGDPTPACGCWLSEVEPEILEPTSVEHPPTPDLMSTLTPRKEPLMLTGAQHDALAQDRYEHVPAGELPERLALPAPEAASAAELAPLVAPYGFKANGTPRKRPAPSPERVAKMLAARGTKTTRVVHATTPELLTRIVEDIDAEIARLQAAKAKLLAVVT
jgi:hypothetical protein